jgi:hypothetical protein
MEGEHYASERRDKKDERKATRSRGEEDEQVSEDVWSEHADTTLLVPMDS